MILKHLFFEVHLLPCLPLSSYPNATWIIYQAICPSPCWFHLLVDYQPNEIPFGGLEMKRTWEDGKAKSE